MHPPVDDGEARQRLGDHRGVVGASYIVGCAGLRGGASGGSGEYRDSEYRDSGEQGGWAAHTNGRPGVSSHTVEGRTGPAVRFPGGGVPG